MSEKNYFIEKIDNHIAKELPILELLHELRGEMVRLQALATCACGDEFTADTIGICCNCATAEWAGNES